MRALVGRSNERKAISAALDAAAAGQPMVLLLEGEAGVGKTRLLDAAADEATASRFQVLRASADDVDRRPVALAFDALGPVGFCPSTGAPGMGPQPDLSGVLVEAAIDAVERVAISGPVLLLVDDVHWADDDSIRWIRALGRRLHGLALALVVAFRPSPRSAALQAAIDRLVDEGAMFCRIGALSDGESVQLALAVRGGPPTAELARMVRAARGNPFLIVELSRALADGMLAPDVGASLPSPLRAAVLRRFERLASDSIEELRFAAMLGSHVVVDDLAALTEQTVATVVRRLAPALASGLLVDHDGRIEFAHDLVQQAIYEDIPLSLRRAVHRRAVHHLDERGAALEAIAVHAERAADGPDRDLYERVMATYHRGVQGSYPASATGLLEVASRLAPDTESHDAVIAPLANHLYRMGRSAEVEAITTPVVRRTTNPKILAEALYGLGSAVWQLGRVEEARAIFSELRTRMEDPYWQVWADVCIAGCEISLGNVEEGIALALDCVDRVAAFPEPDSHTLAAAYFAWMCVANGKQVIGDVPGALDAGLRAADGEWRAYGHRSSVFCGAVLGRALSIADDDVESRSVLERAVRSSEVSGMTMTTGPNLFNLAITHYRSGNLPEALATAEAGLLASAEVEGHPGALFGYGLCAIVRGHQDDVPGARAELARGHDHLGRVGATEGLEWFHWADVLVGDGTAQQAWRTLRRRGFQESFRPIAPDLVRRFLAEGDRERAALVAERAAWLLGAEGSTRAAALRCRGLLEADTLLIEAAETYPENRPLEAAAAGEDAAAALLAAGDITRSRAFLHRALERYETVGAVRDASRVEGSLSAVGVRRRGGSRRSRAQTGWDSLTPAELEVVRLVAEGLTNREVGERLFVARSTVQTHLLHAFSKLGCTSRSQLAVMVATRSEHETQAAVR